MIVVGSSMPSIDQAGLVAGCEVDDDPLLLQHLDGVLHRLDRLDRLGPSMPSSPVSGRGEPEDDQHEADRDHQAGDAAARVEPPLRRRRWSSRPARPVRRTRFDRCRRLDVVDGGVVGLGRSSLTSP